VSARQRLLAVLAGIGLTAALLVAAGELALMRRAVRDGARERIRAEAALLADWVETVAVAADAQQLAVRAARRLDARVTLVAPDGTVIGESSSDAAGLARLQNHLDRPEIQAARLGGAGESVRQSATTRLTYFYSARMVPGAGPVKYARVAVAASELGRLQARHVGLVVALALATMALPVGVGYAAVRRLSRPVERMAAAVERSFRGEHALELGEGRGEEVERLGAAVGRMRQALVEKLAELDGERVLLSSVIGGMREGLLLVGADRRIRLANQALRSVFDLDFDPTGHSLAEVVRHPTVLRDVEAALSEGREAVESHVQLPGSGRSFELHVTPLPPDGGPPRQALALLVDITRLEKLEGVRREFVANVSHELRTPLTSIRAFVETLLEGGLDDRDNAQRFLGIIRKHAERMGALIEDLTDLSLIETGAIALELREVDAADVVRGVIEHLQPLAGRRGIEVASELASPFLVRADRRRLEQMVTNLIDNAIKFSHPGGRVRVHGRAEPGLTVLCVEDHGIGIPAGSLEKVFHRFYQESRDRSREMGGTGLGLAIVKHLMRLHDGRVRVESELGRGARFSLEFPERGEPRRRAGTAD
jgi:two-component system phosphate regulon sensor histidine kinase PhoR